MEMDCKGKSRHVAKVTMAGEVSRKELIGTKPDHERMVYMKETDALGGISTSEATTITT